MNRYESYKETGVQWIGEIPIHWGISRLKFLSNKLRSGGTPKADNSNFYTDESGTPWVAIADMSTVDFVKETEKHLTKAGLKDKNLQIYPAGTLLYSIYATLGKVAELSIPAAINQAILAISLKKNYLQSFCKYVLKAQEKFVIGLASTNTQANLNAEKVSNYYMPVPPLEEQKAIADFLDAKTAELDEEKQNCLKQIDLLKELKQSFIKKSILSTERKQIKLKYILKQSDNNLKVGPFGTALKGDDFKIEGYWVYNQRCVLDNNFVSNDTFVTEQKFSELKSFKVYPQDVLITTRGTIGKIAVVPENAPEGILHPCIIRFVIDEKKYDVRLLKYMFNESDLLLTQVKLMSNSTTIDVLYSYNLKNLRLPLISIDEQHSIANFLDQKTANIDEQIKLQEQQIKLIDELKQSIIAQAVTGKIKVF